MNERRIVEDLSEQDIEEYNNFYNNSAEYFYENNKPQKTLIAKLIIKWQKKKLRNTEIKIKHEIVDSIQESMDWNNHNTQNKELETLPISEKTGDEVLQMKKKSYEELQIATQMVEDELFSSSESTIFSNELFPENKEDIVKLLKKSIKSAEITKEDRDILVDIYGEEAIQLFEQSL